jgi:hypothetical protein
MSEQRDSPADSFFRLANTLIGLYVLYVHMVIAGLDGRAHHRA